MNIVTICVPCSKCIPLYNIYVLLLTANIFKSYTFMKRINNMVSVLLSFSLFPSGLTHSSDDFRKKLSKYQNTNQETDEVNIFSDWQRVGNDIAQAVEKGKNEQ